MDERFRLGRPHIVGWQAIAKYMGVSVRTVKEHHYTHGLPIYKSPTGYRYAIPAALDLWLAAKECRSQIKCPFCKHFQVRKKPLE